MSYSTPESRNAITQRMTKVASASVRPFIRTVRADGMGEHNFRSFAIALQGGCPEAIAEDLAIIDAGALPLYAI